MNLKMTFSQSKMAWSVAVLLAIVLSGGCNRPEAETALVEPKPMGESLINEVHGKNVSILATGDWPLFRGDRAGSGVAKSTLPANDELDVLWEYKVKGRDGAFKSSPVVVRNQTNCRTTVYVADLDGKIYSIDLQTGQCNWNFQAGISIEASPAYKDGHIYIGDLDGKFFCLDEDGGLVWSKELEAPITGAANFHGDNVVFGTDDASLYCLNGKDGEEVWKFSAADQIQCSITVSENTAFVAGCDGQFRICLLYTSPSPRDQRGSRMPSSA